jgi:hypothetical protein
MSLKLTYTLSDLKEVVKKHLLLEDYRVVDVIAATIVANLFPTDPLWLLLIGPPSSAKTELLNATEGFPKTFFISDLTTSTLISGKKGSSLLPRLSGKIIIFKDFTSVLSKRPDDLKIIMGQLREVYDGKLSKYFGTGDCEKWQGHVGFIGASTSVYDRHYGVVGQMGERLILYRIRNKDNMSTGIRALAGFGYENGMRAELKKGFTRFFRQFKSGDLNIPKLSQDLAIKIASLATFCGHGRCPVHRDRFTKEMTHLPDPEGTPRLVKQLYHMGIALMIVHQEEAITEEIYNIIKKIGLDLIPKIRLNVFKCLYKNRATEVNVTRMTTPEVSELTGIHGRTALRSLQDLSAITLVKGRLAEDKQGTPYEWQITDSALKSIGWAEIDCELDG